MPNSNVYVAYGNTSTISFKTRQFGENKSTPAAYGTGTIRVTWGSTSLSVSVSMPCTLSNNGGDANGRYLYIQLVY